MTGILIPNMQIPESCCVCPFRRELNEKDKYDVCGNLRLDDDVCIIQNKIIDRYNGRDYNECPLKEYKTGKWIKVDEYDKDSNVICSNCNMEFSYIDGICYLVCGEELPNYCPNCGGKMV